MLDREVIQSRGFRNVPGGFQVAVRCPYYRGLWASLVEGATVAVDGVSYPADRVRWTLGGVTYTIDELAETDEVRWPYEEAALLTVEEPDGLTPGPHDIEVTVTWRWSYIPVQRQPTTAVATRKLVMVV